MVCMGMAIATGHPSFTEGTVAMLVPVAVPIAAIAITSRQRRHRRRRRRRRRRRYLTMVDG